MTSFVFRGLEVNYGYDARTNRYDVPLSVAPAELRIVQPDAEATFSYVIDYVDDLPGVDITAASDYFEINSVPGSEIDRVFDYIADVEFGYVTTPSGTSPVLAFDWESGPDSNKDFYFIVDGPDFPGIDTLREWKAFEGSVTGAGAATGAFGPNRDIAFADFGNALITEDDEFSGTPGRDSYSGGIGDDYFRSSNGSDTYDGGRGAFDQISFAGDPAGVTADMRTGTATDGWGRTDNFSSIEMLRGSLFDDTLIGDGGTDIFRGLAGADTIDGGKGRDWVRHDRDDRFEGGEAGVLVNLKKGFARDGFGDRDRLISIENAQGSDGNDTLIGKGGRTDFAGLDGNDLLKGLGGGDVLDGGDGRDRLIGGAGNDKLSGGAQADKFIFFGAFGDDVIRDFRTGVAGEVVVLARSATISGFQDLKANHLSAVNGNAVIDDGAGNTITLEGVGVGALSADDFLF